MESIAKPGIAFLFFLAWALCEQAGAAQDRAFTVRDSIEMTRFAYLITGTKNTNVLISPNGENFVLVTSRGILSSNQVESSLWMFDIHAIHSYFFDHETSSKPEPRLLARIAVVPEIASLTAYAPTISSLQWSANSHTLFFLGQDSHAEHRLFKVDISKDNVRALTPKGYDVLRFTTASDRILCKGVRSKPQRMPLTKPKGQEPEAVTGQRLVEILFPETRDTPKVPELWLIRNGTIHTIARLDTKQAQPGLLIENSWDAALSISPHRNQIVWLSPIATTPDDWQEYKTAAGFEHFHIDPHDRNRVSSSSLNRIQQYVITDIGTGHTSPLIEAPVARYLGYDIPVFSRWSLDGRRVLATNTFLPVDHNNSETAAQTISPCSIAIVELASRQTRCLKSVGVQADSLELGKLQDAFFGDTSDEIILLFDTPGGPARIERYMYVDKSWIPASSLPKKIERASSSASECRGHGQLQISVRQSLNDPPALWITDKMTGKSAELWDPNPQFASMKLSKTTRFIWKDKTGYEWSGGLVWPVNYVPGKRYPLVIQIYQFRDKEFMTDGTEPTAMAARPLASAGMFYLQGTKKPVHTLDLREANDHLEGFLSAIDNLASQGLVDSTKVGIIGYSWTCWYVEHALIQAPDRFMAATIADGNDNSYMQYRIIGVGNPAFEEQYERFNGGKPVGPGLIHWMENAPSFHLDQVKTPLRIEAIRPTSLLGEWELYSSLWQQGKPVDLMYFPDGQHILQKPLDRLASQQGNVDWFRFWLEGYEDPDPSKREQYRRWNQIRALTPSVLSGVAPTRSSNREMP